MFTWARNESKQTLFENGFPPLLYKRQNMQGNFFFALRINNIS